MAFVAIVAPCACGGEVPAPPRTPRPTASADAALPAAAPVWAIRYRRANKAVVSLDGGKRVEVGEHGERWLITPQGRSRATTYFPKPIVGGVVSKEGEIAFVADDGTIFPVAGTDPLGPLGAARTPPRSLSKLAIGRNAVVARAERDVVRTVDAGRTWTTLDIGGAPRMLQSVVLARDGTGALLQLPQRTLITDDDGATWIHVSPPPHGVAEIKADDDGKRVVAVAQNTATTMQVAASPPRWIPVRPISTTASTRPDDEANAPSFDPIEAWTRGEAAMTAATWLEMIGTETGIELWTEDLAALTRPRRLRAFPECADAVRVAASTDGRLIGVACKGGRKSTEAMVWSSGDAGEHWRRLPPLVTPNDYMLGIHVTGDRIVVTGACIPEAAVPCPLEAVSSSGGAWSNVQLDGKPPLPIRLGGVAANGSGFVGIATDETDEPTLVTSADGIRAEMTKRFSGARGFDRISRSGDVVVIETTDRESPLQVSRDGGRTWTPGSFPAAIQDWESVSFAGPHGIATTPKGIFETLDAGATWSKLDTPLVDGGGQVRCGASACVFTGTLRRIGWNARTLVTESKPAEAGPRKIVLDEDTLEPAFTCTPGGIVESVNGSFDNALVDLPGGLRWSILRHGADGTQVFSGRRGVIEKSAVLAPQKSLFFQSVNEPNGAAFLEFPGECALNCHGFLYSTTGPIAVSWLPAAGGPMRHASLWPDEKMMKQPVDAKVMPDGGVLVAVAGDAYVLDANGKRTQKVRGHAWDVIAVGKKTVSVADAVTLVENGEGAQPATTWTLDPFGDRASITRAKGQPFVWSQVKTNAFLVKLDKIEEEPSSVIAVDLTKLLATKPLPACTAATRGELRIPFTFFPPMGINILLGHLQRPPVFTSTEIVVRATPDGKACISGIVATSSDRQHGLMLDLADPTHAMTWRNSRTPPSLLESASCRAR